MSFTIIIENIYQIRRESTITGKIEKCNEDILIQDGQSFNIEISSGFIGKGFYPVYGHKKTLLKTGEYFTIDITSKINIPFQIGDVVTVTL
jgi:hypothetical protein